MPTNSRSDAVARVETFLSCMEARDLTAAKKSLGRGFSMTFPGPNTFRSLGSFAAWGKGRYRSTQNRVDRFDVVREGEDTIIYALGAVSGQFGDGTEFRNVRFVDRFVVRHDRIIRFEAWSDISDLLFRRANEPSI